MISDDFIVDYGDIVTDGNNYPHVVWHETVDESQSHPYGDATMYRGFDGDSWSFKEIIVEDPWVQKVVMLNNEVYIYNEEKELFYYKAVIYKRDQNGTWFGTVVTKHGSFCGPWCILPYNNQIYLFYSCRIDGEQSDIFLKKFDVPNEIQTIEISPLILYKNYPNPFKDHTTFKYSLDQKGLCRLRIFDLQGRLMKELVNEKQSPGTYEVPWNGTGVNGNKLPPGNYYYRLTLDQFTMTYSLIIN